jgi:hypothetical protein
MIVVLLSWKCLSTNRVGATPACVCAAPRTGSRSASATRAFQPSRCARRGLAVRGRHCATGQREQHEPVLLRLLRGLRAHGWPLAFAMHTRSAWRSKATDVTARTRRLVMPRGDESKRGFWCEPRASPGRQAARRGPPSTRRTWGPSMSTPAEGWGGRWPHPTHVAPGLATRPPCTSPRRSESAVHLTATPSSQLARSGTACCLRPYLCAVLAC